jgi:hypothetical protein
MIFHDNVLLEHRLAPTDIKLHLLANALAPL